MDDLAAVIPLADRLARRYRFPGEDPDDSVQVARIAAWEALETHDGRSPLNVWVTIVVQAALVDELRRSTRHGWRTLTDAARSAADPETGEQRPLVELVADRRDPYAARETLRLVLAALARLTDLERAALARLLNGEPYSFSSRYDNALQRARRKLRAAAY